MKVVAVSSALFVVFAALLIVIPSPGAAAKVTCSKRDGCLTKDNKNENVETTIECDECAVWGCILNGVLYAGVGCKGDSNVCNGASDNDKKCYDTCLLPIEGSCLAGNICLSGLTHFVTATGECTLTNAGSGTTTTSKDGTKTGALSIGGMILLGWVLARF